jgi:hypothetical protein
MARPRTLVPAALLLSGRPYAAWQASPTRIDAARANLRTGLFGAPDH